MAASPLGASAATITTIFVSVQDLTLAEMRRRFRDRPFSSENFTVDRQLTRADGSVGATTRG